MVEFQIAKLLWVPGVRTAGVLMVEIGTGVLLSSVLNCTGDEEVDDDVTKVVTVSNG